MSTEDITIENILSTLSPSAVELLDKHYQKKARADIMQKLSDEDEKIPNNKIAGKKPAAPKARSNGRRKQRVWASRQRTNDGRTVARFIRDTQKEFPEMSAAEIAKLGIKYGIDISDNTVYKCRADLKESNKKLAQNLVKARKAKKAKAKKQAK